MVLNIVCRRMLGDPADSEDAFQATFLVLVRKRAAIRFEASSGSLALWRERSRCPPCSNPRIAQRLMALDNAPADSTAERRDASDPDLRFAIDELLAGLPANYRAAIVSCYLEGLTHKETLTGCDAWSGRSAAAWRGAGPC